MKRHALYLRIFSAFASIAVVGISGCAATGGAPGAAAAAAAPPTSATAGNTTLVAIAPPAHPVGSIWDFLGIPQMIGMHQPHHQFKSDLFHSIFADLFAAFPAMEPPPAPLSLTDPANAGPDAAPANQAAAEVKEQEDAANQKIKALKYLASIGCQSGYPQVEEAFLASLNDPVEKVRYTAVRALRDVAGSPCEACKTGGSCCTPAILKKLDSLANETDEQGCPLEPSAEVRREARLALGRCGGYIPEMPAEVIEGPIPEPAPLPETEPAAPPAPGAEPAPAPALEAAAVGNLINPVSLELAPEAIPESAPSVSPEPKRLPPTPDKDLSRTRRVFE